MMTAWQYLILNILLVFQTAFSLTREYQLLQQNSYYNSRYFENYTHKLNVNSIIKILDFAVKTLLFFALKNFVLCAVYFTVSAIATFLIQRNIQKKSIKPLVFTARIKRMYFTAFLFMLLLCAADFCILNNGIVTGALALLCLLAFVFCPVVNIINKPIEKAVAGYFINDAKRILKARGNMKIIGITGSFGKTSTKHILYRILSEKYNVFMTPGGINTPLGIVKTVREQLPNDTQIFICEMGAKNIGDIKEICDIVHPDIGIVTSVGAMHLNTFKTVENVKKTKLELADAVSEKHGRIFLNGDNEYLNTEKDKYSAVTFGINNNNDYRAENIYYDKNGSSFVLCTKDAKRIELKTKLLGINNVSNILSALSVAAELGICDSDIKFAVSQLKSVSHRLELKPFINGSILIDDAYNANPVGSKEAINVLASFDGMTKICVTPGLIELGDKEYDENKTLGRHMADKCDKIFLIGEQRSKPIEEGIRSVKFDADVTVFKSFADALSELKRICNRNTVVIFENDLPDNYLK